MLTLCLLSHAVILVMHVDVKCKHRRKLKQNSEDRQQCDAIIIFWLLYIELSIKCTNHWIRCIFKVVIIHKVTHRRLNIFRECSGRIFINSHSDFSVFRLDFIISQDEGSLNWCHSQCTQRCPETAARCERDRKCSSSFWGGQRRQDIY